MDDPIGREGDLVEVRPIDRCPPPTKKPQRAPPPLPSASSSSTGTRGGKGGNKPRAGVESNNEPSAEATTEEIARLVTELGNAKRTIAAREAEAEAANAEVTAAIEMKEAVALRHQRQLESLAAEREEKAGEVAALASEVKEAESARMAAEERSTRLEALLAAAQEEMRALQDELQVAAERAGQRETAHASQLAEQQQLMQRLSSRISSNKASELRSAPRYQARGGRRRTRWKATLSFSSCIVILVVVVGRRRRAVARRLCSYQKRRSARLIGSGFSTTRLRIGRKAAVAVRREEVRRAAPPTLLPSHRSIRCSCRRT